MKRNLMKTSGKYWIMCLLLLLSGCSASRATMPEEPFTFDSIVCSAENTIGKYEGHNGYTALDLLLEVDPTAKYTGTGDTSFVTTVCGKTADNAKHEFWALYANGELANVGAGSLETKDNMYIEWKLERY